MRGHLGPRTPPPAQVACLPWSRSPDQGAVVPAPSTCGDSASWNKSGFLTELRTVWRVRGWCWGVPGSQPTSTTLRSLQLVCAEKLSVNPSPGSGPSSSWMLLRHTGQRARSAGLELRAFWAVPAPPPTDTAPCRLVRFPVTRPNVDFSGLFLPFPGLQDTHFPGLCDTLLASTALPASSLVPWPPNHLPAPPLSPGPGL